MGHVTILERNLVEGLHSRQKGTVFDLGSRASHTRTSCVRIILSQSRFHFGSIARFTLHLKTLRVSVLVQFQLFKQRSQVPLLQIASLITSVENHLFRIVVHASDRERNLVGRVTSTICTCTPIIFNLLPLVEESHSS